MGLSVWKSLRVLLNQRLLGGGGRGAYEGAEEWIGGDWRWGILAVKENGVAWSPNMGGWQRFPNLAVDPNPLEGDTCMVGFPASPDLWADALQG